MKKILTLCIIIPVAWACDSLLEKKPNFLAPETYFNTVDDLESFLIGVYSPLKSSEFYGINYQLYNAGGDDLSYYGREDAPTCMLCANANSGNQYIRSYWSLLYTAINRANMLLENIDKPEAGDAVRREEIRAEALFLRAFYHWNLVQGWGDVPLKLQSTQSVSGLNAPRDDKQVVYERIIEDMKKAMENMPESDELDYTGRPTRSAVCGLLARIYLFRAGEHHRDGRSAGPEVTEYLEQAKYWAAQVVDSNLHGLVDDYEQVFIDLAADLYNSTGVRESIWEVEFLYERGSSNSTSGRIGNMIGFGGPDFSTDSSYDNATGMRNPGYSYNFIYSSLKLVQMYDRQGDNIRSHWNIAPYKYKMENGVVVAREYYTGKKPADLDFVEGYPCIEEENQTTLKALPCAKYKREYETRVPKDKNYTSINYPILRYSDVLLMLAEAENELNGPTELAYDCINQVRRRVGIAELSGLSQDELREAIKDERAMELCFEGTRRWDLIRWGEFTTKMWDMLNYSGITGGGPAYTSAYYMVTPAYVYFPIPDLEISVNKAMTQNPGW